MEEAKKFCLKAEVGVCGGVELSFDQTCMGAMLVVLSLSCSKPDLHSKSGLQQCDASARA